MMSYDSQWGANLVSQLVNRTTCRSFSSPPLCEIYAKSAGSSTAQSRRIEGLCNEQKIEIYHLLCTYLSMKSGKRR